ncbi:MAG TPA: hypothetical protein VNH21_12330 [Steroidobacteraceae bacterium]|nr:hypothetical protein [Steroidobacteraceae bacterium]
MTPFVVLRTDAKLDQIEARWPGVLSVRYADLATGAAARMFLG